MIIMIGIGQILNQQTQTRRRKRGILNRGRHRYSREDIQKQMRKKGSIPYLAKGRQYKKE